MVQGIPLICVLTHPMAKRRACQDKPSMIGITKAMLEDYWRNDGNAKFGRYIEHGLNGGANVGVD